LGKNGVAEESDKWQDVVKAVMNLLVKKMRVISWRSEEL
jgi:hypothetical protein